MGLDRRNNASENKKENCAITRLLNSRLWGDMVKAVALMPMVNDEPKRVVSLIASATRSSARWALATVSSAAATNATSPKM